MNPKTYQEAAFHCRVAAQEARQMKDIDGASKHVAKAFQKLLKVQNNMKQWIVRHYGEENLPKIWMAIHRANAKDR